MKLNWGTSVVLAFMFFMAFILYFVFTVQSDSKYDNELVVEEYYKKDATFGQEMQKLQNANRLLEKPVIEMVTEGIRVSFPKSIGQGKITGEIAFYRPSSKKLDFSKALELSNHSMLIPKHDMAGGVWNTTLYWSFGGQEYMLRKEIYIN